MIDEARARLTHDDGELGSHPEDVVHADASVVSEIPYAHAYALPW